MIIAEFAINLTILIVEFVMSLTMLVVGFIRYLASVIAECMTSPTNLFDKQESSLAGKLLSIGALHAPNPCCQECCALMAEQNYLSLV